jgi:hypothetical protein
MERRQIDVVHDPFDTRSNPCRGSGTLARLRTFIGEDAQLDPR